jgi:hypothetical protein
MREGECEGRGQGEVLPGIWPGTVELEGIVEGNGLTQEQDQRVTALYHARGVLERRGGVMVGKDSSIPPTVSDLIRLTRFIIKGE